VGVQPLSFATLICHIPQRGASDVGLTGLGLIVGSSPIKVMAQEF